MQGKLLEIIRVDFKVAGKLLIIYSALVISSRKKWEQSEAVHQLFIEFKQAYDSVRRDIL